MDVDEISLLNCRIKDFSFCSYVKDITVIQTGVEFKGDFDFSFLQNIEKGVFRFNTIVGCVNYHLLGNLKSLELSACPSIIDVSCFKNVPHLTLNGCFGITDVSSLKRVHTLSLRSCQNVSDISALSRIHTLDLSFWTPVTDLSALELVYSLTFEGFTGTDVSGLKNIGFLDISGSEFVTVLLTL
jgi:hypothetical protein